MAPRTLLPDPLRVAVAMILLGLLATNTASAQVPRDLPPPTPQRTMNDPAGGLPQLPPGMMPGQAVAVVPDTARIAVQPEEGSAQPAAIFVVPDTVLFGDIAAMVCRFPVGSEAPGFAGFGQDAELSPLTEEISAEHLDRLEAWAAKAPYGPATGQNSVMIVFRSYRADPFLVTWGDVESQVVSVRGRTEDLSQTAPIRVPRSWGWNLWTVAGLALVCVLVVLLGWLLWSRRARHDALTDWELAQPAWITASGRLRSLLESAAVDRGQEREFLNELASIARGFAADRYRIAAREMTGQEIVLACRRLGYRTTVPARLARLVDEADRRRYDPDPVDATWCRQQAVELIEQMAAVRILPRQTNVAAEIRLEADRAWMKLQEHVKQTVPGALLPKGGA